MEILDQQPFATGGSFRYRQARAAWGAPPREFAGDGVVFKQNFSRTNNSDFSRIM